MKCMNCKTMGMKDDTTTYFANLDKCYVIIEHVPCKKCEQCGEEFFSTSVIEKIDEILEKIAEIASKIFIMDYQSVA
ncbi:MAG: type II toxin-antitoxin system MqsA family antitoxin [Eubacteriales bacterium]